VGGIPGPLVTRTVCFAHSKVFLDMDNTLVTEKGLLEAFPVLKPRQLRRLRREGKIPHLRLSPRSVLYDCERVLDALRKMEVSG
jgi:hypothetical protein